MYTHRSWRRVQQSRVFRRRKTRVLTNFQYTTAIYHRTTTTVSPVLPLPRCITAAISNVTGRTAVARIKLHNR